jgi:30S ribosomal protein S31
MGKGDKKSKRGKILMGSYGVRRPRRKQVTAVLPAEVIEEKPVVAVKPKAPAKPKAEKPPVAEEKVNMAVTPEETAKPEKKKTAPKAAKKEEKAEE